MLPFGAECTAKPFSTDALLRKVRELLDRDGVRAGDSTMVES